MPMMRAGLHKPTTWDDVEVLILELFELEGLGDISPQAYARRCIEARLAEAHERRHQAADDAEATQGRHRRMTRSKQIA
jgi:hypothetical protein